MNTNTNTNTTTNENLLSKFKTPGIFYIIMALIIFLIIMTFVLLYGFKIQLPSSNQSSSQQQMVADIFIVLFFSLLVFGLCILFLPNMKEFKQLFEQISSVTYVILYTIFVILFYTMLSPDILNNYSYIINPIILALGIFSFYKGASESYIEKFNVNYERIKMLIIFFCILTLSITFYNINPGGAAEKYFGYSLLLTIIISVFAFLYVIILLTLPGEEGKTSKNLLTNFSSFGLYSSIGFILFLVIITSIISSDKDNFFSNKAKSSGVMILILLICIMWTILIGANLFAGQTTGGNLKTLNSSLLILFGLVISGLIIFWITYNIEKLSGKSSITSFILNLLLVAIMLGLIYKTFNVNVPSGNNKKNAFFNLIISTILYIPCILGDTFDWFGKMTVGHYDATNAGSVIMLFVAIGLIVAYFKSSSLLNFVSTQGGNQLVNRPVYTDTVYNLGSYQDLNGSDDFDYQYAISCWIFIDASPPNTNPNYTKFTSLLNFGNKPNILYNPSKNKLMITMQQKELKETTKNKLIDFDDEGNRIVFVNDNFLLQKWNNIIINYNGGTMDIFLNGELVKSSIEVVPYYTYDNLTIGENDGIKGGICNVVYFRNALTSTNIYYLYNSVKNITPPILNDTNETIMKKNINTAINSVKTVS
jgi:hypothetical protein